MFIEMLTFITPISAIINILAVVTRVVSRAVSWGKIWYRYCYSNCRGRNQPGTSTTTPTMHSLHMLTNTKSKNKNNNTQNDYCTSKNNSQTPCVLCFLSEICASFFFLNRLKCKKAYLILAVIILLGSLIRWISTRRRRSRIATSGRRVTWPWTRVVARWVISVLVLRGSTSRGHTSRRWGTSWTGRRSSTTYKNKHLISI